MNFHKQQVDALKKENITLKKESAEMKSTLQKANVKCKADREDLEWAMQSHDDLEQYTRKHNLEIHGIPEVEDENLCGQVVKLGNLLNVSIQRSEIDIYLKWLATTQISQSQSLRGFDPTILTLLAGT